MWCRVLYLQPTCLGPTTENDSLTAPLASPFLSTILSYLFYLPDFANVSKKWMIAAVDRSCCIYLEAAASLLACSYVIFA